MYTKIINNLNNSNHNLKLNKINNELFNDIINIYYITFLNI